MKTRAIALAVIAAASTGLALAAEQSQPRSEMGIAQLVNYLEATYPGKVTAIERDDSGDKSSHYHVVMQFAQSGPGSFDIDPSTLVVGQHDATPGDRMTNLPYAASVVAGRMRGQVIAAQFDGSEGAAPHYDIDVRVPDGTLRMKVDAATLEVGWREPAIIPYTF